MDFYYQLRAQGNEHVRLMRYPKCTHAIDIPDNEADAWLHVLLFLRRHVFDKTSD